MNHPSQLPQASRYAAHRFRSRRTAAWAAAAAFAAVAGLTGNSGTAFAQLQPPSSDDRRLGFDISAWQGDITQAEWNTFKRPTNQSVGGVFGDGRDFVFIRSSRGGTTGFYNQSNAGNNNPPGQNTLSQRYDDPYYVRNITRATAAGLYAGSYHFSRPDIVAGTLNSNGIPNNGTDEANHFMQMASPWMRPGYLLPVHDLEAGISQRTSDELAQFGIDFSNRIYDVMGIRPAVYIGGNYANHLQGASQSLRNQVTAAYPVVWSARWPNQADPNSIPVQAGHPKDTYTPIYGPWDDGGTTHPWTFWQYASTARLNGNNGGASNTDVNVVQGNMDFLKDKLVPAVWMSGASGNWASLANWNSGQTAVAPVTGPGQVPMFGSMTLPGARLPGRPDPSNAANGTNVTGQDDTVNLNRPNENITVTYDSTVPNTTIRKLFLNERLNVTGGNLTVAMGGVAGAGGTLSLSGGTVTMDSAIFDVASALEFAGNGTLSVGSILLNSGLSFNGSAGTGILQAKAGAPAPAVNFGNATRTFSIGEGSAAVDMRVSLPLTNGALIKTGAGTLELTANNSAFAGSLTVADGHLLVTSANQLGTAGVATDQFDATTGGTVRLLNTGTVNKPISIRGLGSNGTAALENFGGDNTWSGSVFLAGAQHNQGQAGLNQIGSAAGTLTITGTIQDSGAARSWAKTGPGDVVLAGAAANSYSNLTRVFGGRLILEKNGALGTPGDAASATGNTYQLPGAVSTIAFRSASGLNYADVEWIHTEGTGVGGLGQLDNLGGSNVFAGHLGLGGPTGGPLNLRQATIGVSAGSLEITGGLYSRFDSAAPTDLARHVTKLGAGTLTLSGDSGPAPTNASDRSLVNSTFTVGAGTLVLAGTASDEANIPGVSSWEVANGATLRIERAGATGTAALALATGATARVKAGIPGALSVRGLTVAGTGRLDLNDTGLIDRNSGSGSAGQTVTRQVTALLKSGLENGGAFNWLGSGIGSTEANVDNATAGSMLYGLGVIQNNRAAAGTPDGTTTDQTAGNEVYASFEGRAVGLNDTLVKFTYMGDADLDGLITGTDYSLIDGGMAASLSGWLNGDFDYSGSIDGTDYALIDNAFASQVGPLGEAFLARYERSVETFGQSYLDALALVQSGVVPEPGTLGVLALAGVGLVGRRGRRPRVPRG